MQHLPWKSTAALAATWLACLQPAHAAEGYAACTGYVDNVPATITSTGTWCLRHDLSTDIEAGMAIRIDADNVTIDCNHFKLGGLAAGYATAAIGISADDRRDITIRNCHVRGFRDGIRLTSDPASDGGHLVEGNRVEGSFRTGILVHGDGSLVRDNLVMNAGGYPASATGQAFGIFADGDVYIQRNAIAGVAAREDDAGDSSAYGIVLDASNFYAGNATVEENRISGIASLGDDIARGIYIADPTVHTVVAGNRITSVGGGLGTAIAIDCAAPGGSTGAVAAGNVVNGFPTAVSHCIDAGNSVEP